MKLIRIVQSKIVKVNNKYQVQSEKGKNLGTYDTKSEAEERLKQVEMFKHMKSNDEQFSDFLRKLETVGKEYDVDVDDISYGELDLRLYDDDKDVLFKVDLDFDLSSFQKGYNATFYEPGEPSYYDDYTLNKITITEIDGQSVNINIPVNSNFGKWIYDVTVEEYTTNEDYFPSADDYVD